MPPAPDWLSSVRQGALSYRELLAWVEKSEANLVEAERTTSLPESPDLEWAQEQVVGLTEAYLKKS